MPALKHYWHYRLIAVFAMLLVAGGCTSGNQPDPYVGNMDDFSYAGRRGKSYGPSASGKTIEMADFKGRFVWIDFTPPVTTNVTDVTVAGGPTFRDTQGGPEPS